MLDKRIALAATLTLAGIGSVHAEALGLLNGRSANPESLPQLSVEGGFVTGDLYQDIGARVNYRLSPELVVYGDIGMVEFIQGDSEIGFGAGAYYFLGNQQFLPQYDVAVKGSYHVAECSFFNDILDEFGGFFGGVGDASADVTNLAVEGIVSAQEPIAANGLKWYANAGLNILGGDCIDSTELLIGGGVYLPAGPGEFYAGIDLVDQLEFGFGFRYFVQ